MAAFVDLAEPPADDPDAEPDGRVDRCLTCSPAPTRPPATGSASDLDTTLFVEAGAGSGKTSALVDRVLALVVERRTSSWRTIAAITFTEKAAAELRDRHPAGSSRTAAERRPASAEVAAAAGPRSTSSTGPPSARCTRSPSGSSPSTRSRPGCRPGSRCSTRSARRWPSSGAGRLPRRAARPTRRSSGRSCCCSPAGVKPAALRSLAEAFDDNWDLVAERVPGDRARPTGGPRPAVRRRWPRSHDVCATSRCRDPSDKLRARLDEIAGSSPASSRAIDDELDLLEALGPSRPQLPSFKVGNGRQAGSWDCDLADAARPACRGRATRWRRSAPRWPTPAPGGSAAPSAASPSTPPASASAPASWSSTTCWCWPAPCCATRRTAPAVRRRLHERYQRLLLDEFQDTDPIQIELAVRIAAADPRGRRRRARDRGTRWTVAAGPPVRRRRPQAVDLPLPAGRHRHLPAGRGDRFGARRRRPVELTANFRTVAPIIEWVNAHLRRAHGRARRASSCRCPRSRRTWPLDAARGRRRTPARRWRSSGATSTPRARRPTSCAAPRPSEVAATVARVDRRGLGGRRRRRAAGGRPGSATSPSWCPARTSLPFLEDAFDAAGIAFRAETQLARLRQPGRPRPAHGPAGGRRPDQRAARRVRPAHAAARPAATTTSSASSASAGAAGATWPTSPTPCRPTIRSRPASPTCARCYDQRHWLAPVRAARPDRPGPAGPGARLRRGPAPRRLAAAALRDRPGPGLERGHRRQPAPVPALGGRCRPPRGPG